MLVVAGCKWASPAEAQPFWRDVQEDYRAVGAEGDPPPPPEAIGPHHLPPDARALSTRLLPSVMPLRWSTAPATTLPTCGPSPVTRQLGEEARAEFLARVEDRPRRLGWPNLTASFRGLLTVGRVIAPAVIGV